MACLLVPAAEAVITTVITKVIKSKEKEEEVQISLPDGSVCEATRIRFSSKLGWLWTRFVQRAKSARGSTELPSTNA